MNMNLPGGVACRDQKPNVGVNVCRQHLDVCLGADERRVANDADKGNALIIGNDYSDGLAQDIARRACTVGALSFNSYLHRTAIMRRGFCHGRLWLSAKQALNLKGII
jgi:hypothetical protein